MLRPTGDEAGLSRRQVADVDVAALLERDQAVRCRSERGRKLLLVGSDIDGECRGDEDRDEGQDADLAHRHAGRGDPR